MFEIPGGLRGRERLRRDGKGGAEGGGEKLIGGQGPDQEEPSIFPFYPD